MNKNFYPQTHVDEIVGAGNTGIKAYTDVQTASAKSLIFDLALLDGSSEVENEVYNNFKEIKLLGDGFADYRITVVNGNEKRIGLLGPNGRWIYKDNAVGETIINNGILVNYDWDKHNTNYNATKYSDSKLQLVKSILHKEIDAIKALL